MLKIRFVILVHWYSFSYVSLEVTITTVEMTNFTKPCAMNKVDCLEDTIQNTVSFMSISVEFARVF